MSIGVLVLCTGNSCRSILAEVLFRDLGADRIRAYSAGSRPAGAVNPGALKKLAEEGHSTAGLSSKSWDEFSAPDAPRIDIVITVCDSAANESCPVWPGAPLTVHWGIPDPDGASDLDAAFEKTWRQLHARVSDALSLQLETMEPPALREALQGIHTKANDNESA